jgi:hypothetical protein
MQQLGPDVRLERGGSGLDEPQAEVDMTEESSLLRLPEGRPGGQLRSTADVVQQGRGEQ